MRRSGGRAKPGRILGALVALLVVMKGLPLPMARYAGGQEAGVPTPSTICPLAIAAMTGMVKDLEPIVRRCAGRRWGPLDATDLADWLVRPIGTPFREAHHIPGNSSRLPRRKACDLAGLDLADMRKINGEITEEVFDVLTVEASIARARASVALAGNVRREARRWLKALAGASRCKADCEAGGERLE